MNRDCQKGNKFIPGSHKLSAQVSFWVTCVTQVTKPIAICIYPRSKPL